MKLQLSGGRIIHLMEVSLLELSKVGRGEKIDIHGVGIRLPNVQKKKKKEEK